MLSANKYWITTAAIEWQYCYSIHLQAYTRHVRNFGVGDFVSVCGAGVIAFQSPSFNLSMMLYHRL